MCTVWEPNTDDKEGLAQLHILATLLRSVGAVTALRGAANAYLAQAPDACSPVSFIAGPRCACISPRSHTLTHSSRTGCRWTWPLPTSEVFYVLGNANTAKAPVRPLGYALLTTTGTWYVRCAAILSSRLTCAFCPGSPVSSPRMDRSSGTR